MTSFDGFLCYLKDTPVQGELVKIREFNLVIISLIFPQNAKFGLETEIFEISRISA